MIVKELRLENFLSYKLEEIKLSRGINIIKGPNASGKTNLVESIYYMSIAKASKGLKDKELVNWHSNTGAKIKMILDKNHFEQSIEIHIDNLGKKRIKVDDEPISKLGELVGNVKVVYFSPDELKLIKDTPQDRRRFLDISLSQQSKAYFYALQKYNRVLKQRNQLLKKHKDKDYLKPMIKICDKTLVELGSYIIKERLSFINTFRDIALNNNLKLTNGKEVLEIAYLSEKVDIDNIEASIEKLYLDNLEKDIRFECTSVGPHRDDLMIFCNGVDLKKYGSQGQQRCAVLAMKLAEIKMFELKNGEKPILILDDVFSELDESRQKAILCSIKDLQTIITCTDFEIKGIDKYTEFTIVKSKITNIKKVRNGELQ